MYPLDRKIEEAFDRSDRVAIEANLNALDAKMDLQKLLEKAVYLDEDTLEKNVWRETYELIRKKGDGRGILLELMNRQKPWVLGLMFSLVGFLKLGSIRFWNRPVFSAEDRRAKNDPGTGKLPLPDGPPVRFQ